MSATNRPRSILRSVGAVLAGLLAGAILSVATDLVLHAAHVYPPWGHPVADSLLLLATVYRTIYSVAGSYSTARFAPNRPMQHALALGVVGVVLSTVGAVATWNRGPAFGPHWYPISLIVLSMPSAWAGGKLFEVRGRR